MRSSQCNLSENLGQCRCVAFSALEWESTENPPQKKLDLAQVSLHERKLKQRAVGCHWPPIRIA
jgi:hypothetical protein